MVRLLEGGYEPAGSDVLDRIAAVLSAETSEGPASNGAPAKNAAPPAHENPT